MLATVTVNTQNLVAFLDSARLTFPLWNEVII
jgi:hypothetical protein